MGQVGYVFRTDQLDFLTPSQIAILGAREITRALVDVGDGPDADRHGWTWEEAYRFLRIVLSLKVHLKVDDLETRQEINFALAAFSNQSGPSWEATMFFRETLDILDAVAPERHPIEEVCRRLNLWLETGLFQKDRYQNMMTDLRSFGKELTQEVLSEPLLPDGDQPEHALTIFLGALDQPPLIGSFWRDWYQGFLNGKPLDWELQRQVALIPDEEWEQGPTHIAERIEEIRKRFELEARIADLEAERTKGIATEARLGIGGNNPPEALDESEDITRQITIIWAAIDALKAETRKESTAPATVAKIIKTLGKGLLAILNWCARKGDLATDNLIKWGIPAGAAALVANPELLKAVIDAAKAWFRIL